MTPGSDSPILKIGAVVVRRVSGLQSPVASAASLLATDDSRLTTPQILILRPIPKTPGETPSFVLPRGTRQYQDADGNWHDARDASTGEKYRERLEDFSRGIAREIEEEAGVTAEMLVRARVVELGSRAFQSRTKGVYPIYWFVVMLDAADAATLTDTLPEDATELRWATLDEIRAMAARGEFSAGYVPVIEEALAAI